MPSPSVLFLTRLLRRRYVGVGLIGCLILMFIVYTIPNSEYANLGDNLAPERVYNPNRDAIPHRKQPLPIPTNSQRVDSGLSIKYVEHPIQIVDDLKSVTNATTTVITSTSTAAPTAVTQKKVEVILKGNYVARFPYAFNLSNEVVSNLLKNSLYFRQLQESVNKTREYLLKVQPDFDANSAACKCRRISEPCVCCTQVSVKSINFKGKACLNFTYLPSKQALRVRLAFEDVLVVEKLLSQASMPLLCAGGSSVHLCVHFRNVSYSVQIHSDHKTTFRGCVDILVTLGRKDIAIYPLGCFMAQRDPKFVQMDKMGNWVP